MLKEFGDETGKESDAGSKQIDQNADVETLPLIVTTGYGCNAGNWSLFYLQ